MSASRTNKYGSPLYSEHRLPCRRRIVYEPPCRFPALLPQRLRLGILSRRCVAGNPLACLSPLALVVSHCPGVRYAHHVVIQHKHLNLPIAGKQLGNSTVVPRHSETYGF